MTDELGGGFARPHADGPEAQEAAELASQQADPDRLMDGEDPKTQDVDDAVHWLSVYRELQAFKEDLLAKLRSRVAGMATGDAQEEALADERLLELELQRFQRRQEFWRERIAELRET